MVNWATLANKVETDVDAQFGETVVFHPYKKSQYMSDTVADNSRNAITATGYALSRFTMAARQSGAASLPSALVRRAQTDLIVACRQEAVSAVQETDRVFLRNRWFNIAFVEHWENGRDVFHLLKIHS